MRKFNIACVGLGKAGLRDFNNFRKHAIVDAVCDSNHLTCERFLQQHPGINIYQSYKHLLANERHIDGVAISTPDASHYELLKISIEKGLNIFCQKPLVRTLKELFEIKKALLKTSVVTQLATFGVCSSNGKKMIHLLQSNILGEIKDVHIWTDRLLNFDKSSWRRKVEFGTGAIGDMGTHYFSVLVKGLGLKLPYEVIATWSGKTESNFPDKSKITFCFRHTRDNKIEVHWYDGGMLPESSIFDQVPPSSNGLLIIGSKGKIFAPNWYFDVFEHYDGMSKKIVRNESTEYDIYTDWLMGLASKSYKPYCELESFGILVTEIILIGSTMLKKECKQIRLQSGMATPYVDTNLEWKL